MKVKAGKDNFLTVQGLAVFFEKILRPILKEIQQNHAKTLKEISGIHDKMSRIARRTAGVHQECLTLTDQYRRIELRLQGATQQAVVVLKDNIRQLEKRLDELERSK